MPWAWSVRLLVAAIMLLVYLTISAEGMRSLFEVASTPLHKTGLWPLTVLGRFAETRKLDLAHVLSLALLVVVWISWEQIVCFFANEQPLTNPRRIIWAGGAVVLVCDAILFWIGISQTSFFGGASIFAATLITALYVAMLILVATWTNILEGKIK